MIRFSFRTSRAAAVLLSDPCFQLRSIQYLLGEGEGGATAADSKHFSLHTCKFERTQHSQNTQLHRLILKWRYIVSYFGVPSRTWNWVCFAFITLIASVLEVRSFGSLPGWRVQFKNFYNFEGILNILIISFSRIFYVFARNGGLPGFDTPGMDTQHFVFKYISSSSE